MFFFFPIGTTRPHWRVPWVTYSIMGLNGLVFLVQLGSPESMPRGFVPAHPSLLTWLLATFMHAGPFHLAGNMLFLWLFGTLAEDVLGPWAFIGFYLAGDAGATVLDFAMDSAFTPQSLDLPRLGASGAIAGIMGLSAICFLRTRVRVWYLAAWYILYVRTDVAEIRAPVFLGLWVGWELLLGLVGIQLAQLAPFAGGGVAHWAHVGGFVAGLAGALALRVNRRIAREDLLTGRADEDTAFSHAQEQSALERMVFESPSDAEAWLALGRERVESGELKGGAEAYHQAIVLFARQHRLREAGEAYLGLAAVGQAAACPPELLFDVACGLEEGEHPREACESFRQVAERLPSSPTTETALIRAGELARSRLGEPNRAAECYRKLLQDYPDSEWRGFAQDRLQELALPEPQARAQAQPEEPTPARPIDPDLSPLGGEATADRG